MRTRVVSPIACVHVVVLLEVVDVDEDAAEGDSALSSSGSICSRYRRL